jgi:hypothetical protein
MAAARQRYFTANGFDGSYDERWVRLKAGPIPIVFPNAPGRVRAVKLHDLHHVATGYQTTWTGEGEIGAWEIAGGCAHFLWAWGLNFSALIIGVVIAPRAIFRAFVRGRHTRNLYRSGGEFEEAILTRTVGEVRRDLELDRPTPPPTASDVAAFALWTTVSAIHFLAPPVALAFLVSRAL